VCDALGGIDSLTIMKYLKEAYAGKLHSLTYSFKGLHPNELEPARMAARHFGTEHHEVMIDPEDAGAFSSRICKQTQQMAPTSRLLPSGRI